MNGTLSQEHIKLWWEVTFSTTSGAASADVWTSCELSLHWEDVLCLTNDLPKLQQECFMVFYLVCMMEWFIWTVRVHLYSCVPNWAVTVNGTFEECTLFRLDDHDDSASKSDPCIAKGAFIDHYILHVVSGYAGFTLPPKSTKEYDKFLSLVSSACSARKDRWMMLTISTQTFFPFASLFANEHC